MKRNITGFEQDESGDWVALLECGHKRHVRHTPPWNVREWVLTAEGRYRYLEYELTCALCEDSNGEPTDSPLG